MIITNCSSIPSGTPSHFAWAGLRRYLNVAYVEELICQLNGLNASQRANVRKQATQIRYCLLQAQEYFDAAGAVSLATKPNLYYYSIMSLALAEILFKQTGLSSLDKAREQHKHHGLELHVRDLPKGTKNLAATASALSANP